VVTAQDPRLERARKPSAVESAFSARHDRAKITDWVFEELKSAIIDLRLPPGEPLRETTIAESLGVSKTPVREALTRLEVEGLVESTSFKGAVVSNYTRNDLVELYELRELLEVWAVREAATSMESDALARLDEIVAAGERLRAEGRTEELEKAIDNFDGFLFEQVTNGRISALIDNLRAHLIRIGRLTAEIPGRLATSVDEHGLIAEALRRHDPDAAAAALRKHIASVREEQLRTLVDRAEGI
jgi:DNA-binding GntR family transcriptional regulator